MRSPRPNYSCVFTLCLGLAACPGEDLQSSSSSTGDPDDTGSSGTGDTPTGASDTGDEPTTTEAISTGAETTTGGADGAVTRVVYYSYVNYRGYAAAGAMRFVEVVDGVAAPPVTILDPPGQRLIMSDAFHRGRWATVYSAPEDAPQLWLVDLQAMTPHEVALPPTIERVDHARISRDGTHVILRGAPLDGSSVQDMSYYVCTVGPQGECSLQAVEPATGPGTYVSFLFDVSGEAGRIWYETEALDGATSYILQGDVGAPEAATTLYSVMDAPAWIERISSDGSTLYFTTTMGNDMQAIDISGDPAGPPVEIHPPLEQDVTWKWSDDGSTLLVWNGFGQFGDLYRVAVDGATAGPMQLVNSDHPGHTTALGNSVTADGSAILFASDHETPMFTQLYITATETPGSPPVRVNAPVAAETSIGLALPAGDLDHIIYVVLDPVATEYHRARIDPPGEVHQLSTDDTLRLPGSIAVADDGARMLYVGELSEDHNDLFMVDIVGDQPAAPILLTESLPPDIEVGEFPSLGPHADLAFFAGFDSATHARRGLYMVPLSPAVAPPIQISDDGETVYTSYVLPAQ